MSPQTIENRVENLEQRVTVLEEVPARIDALTLQVSQLREEMHAEFSAIRAEFKSDLRHEISALRDEFKAELRSEIADAKNQSRILYEDVIARLALIQEGLNGRGRSRRAPKKR